MRQSLHYSIAAVMAALLSLSACDDNTANLGIYAENDGIANSDTLFTLVTRSIKMDSVVASSNVSYLGCITDPETATDITADFAAQFYTFENYKFPEKKFMVGDVDGQPTPGVIQCDSCEVRLYFDNYYGDENNPMKLEAYLLSSHPDSIMSEDSVYYTDIDLTRFIADRENPRPLATRVFTPKDFNVSEQTLSTSDYSKNVLLRLPASVGQHIMEKYYENPDSGYFADSYHFIRNVFPGLYFRTSGGRGTMLSVYVGTLNIFYRYYDELEDSTYTALTRFAATPEVIQSTHFDNGNMDALLAPGDYTYLKTPAGICTEMTLPIDEVFAGSHASDSISMARITLNRYNKPQDNYQLGTPQELLMVRKQDARDFFTNHRVSDGRTSYTTTFNSTYNSYTFSNIGRLLSYCKHEKQEALRKAQETDPTMTEARWMADHPDWNKVWLIPVTTSSTTTSGYTSQVSVTHDLSLRSVRLVGGNTPLKMQVVYSKFRQQ